jgi:hypothetical protein
MKRICRIHVTSSQRKRELRSAEILRHARVITDPAKLAYLYAEVEKRNARERAAANRFGHEL